jgi:hypothetical protein
MEQAAERQAQRGQNMQGLQNTRRISEEKGWIQKRLCMPQLWKEVVKLKFRRYFHSFADIEAESEDECDNIDVSDQINDNLVVISSEIISD